MIPLVCRHPREQNSHNMGPPPHPSPAGTRPSPGLPSERWGLAPAVGPRARAHVPHFRRSGTGCRRGAKYGFIVRHERPGTASCGSATDRTGSTYFASPTAYMEGHGKHATACPRKDRRR
ncbi:hypothetical protein LX36DRAFT_464083 [Colletotrichum falcatum]|nr:hypothetical protein LX36DRAFT_464083 [Colletotrichum falcatum]